MKTEPKIFVIGMGNILLSDEGAGVRAVERLMASHTFPANVQLIDGGTTAMKGLLPLVEEADHVIALDTVNGPGGPGALYRYDASEFRRNIPKKISAHDIGFLECLAIAEVNGRAPESVVILGIQPADISTPSMELSPEVKAGLDGLCAMAVKELERLGVAGEPLNPS